MADFSARAPVEATKAGAYLHDRTRIPRAPKLDRDALVQRYLGYALGIALALAAMALMFQTRASWTRGREFVVPTTAPLVVIGGIALGHLLARRRFVALTPALLCIGTALTLTAFNIWRGTQVDGPNTGRDVMSLFTGVSVALAVVCLVVALVVVEWRDPVRPPQPAG